MFRAGVRMVKGAQKCDLLPAQPWRLLHPPALSLPRQPLRPATRLVPGKAPPILSTSL